VTTPGQPPEPAPANVIQTTFQVIKDAAADLLAAVLAPFGMGRNARPSQDNDEGPRDAI
jgi:hypothetical protein